ncbi:MAG: transcription/translation regulatory transformer protein RfaH [Gallionella sp.]|nr:transcription/translation regulatory transformer protein RfaH [Gallionella sp.]
MSNNLTPQAQARIPLSERCLNSISMDAEERWFAVSCKPRQEAVAEENLLRQGYRVYLPRIQNTHHRRGQWVDVIEPLFPRYLFIRINPALRSTAPVRSTRGAVGLVRFGGQPAVIPDEVIEAIVQREAPDSGLHWDDRPLFCAGEPVRLEEGPLAGMEGIFVERDGEKRVIILLELLGKANKIRINRDWVVQAA